VPGLTPAALQTHSSVTPVLGSNFLTFTATNSVPSVAERVVKAYSNAYVDYRYELDTKFIADQRAALERRKKELEAQGAGSSQAHGEIEHQIAELDATPVQKLNVLHDAFGPVKIGPRTKRNGAIGVFLGIILGVSLAFLWDLFDTRVRSIDTVRSALRRLPLLGRLPTPPRALRKHAGLVMLTASTSDDAEPFRVLRANFELAVADVGAKTIMVTSGISGEGKSTTVANLAVALARSGRRVVLIDFDLRKPGLHGLFGLDGSPGLIDVTLFDAPLESALAAIPLANVNGNGKVPYHSNGSLEVLPLGTTLHDPDRVQAELVVARTVGSLRDRADYVLIDAGPILPTGDTIALSAHVDAIMLVVRLNGLPRSALDDVDRVLVSSPAAKLGFVLTGDDSSLQKPSHHPGPSRRGRRMNGRRTGSDASRTNETSSPATETSGSPGITQDRPRAPALTSAPSLPATEQSGSPGITQDRPRAPALTSAPSLPATEQSGGPGTAQVKRRVSAVTSAPSLPATEHGGSPRTMQDRPAVALPALGWGTGTIKERHLARLPLHSDEEEGHDHPADVRLHWVDGVIVIEQRNRFEDRLELLDPASGAEVFSISAYGRGCAAYKDGLVAFSRAEVGQKSDDVNIHSLDGRSAPHRLDLGKTEVYGLQFSPDGATVLVAFWSRPECALYSAETGQRILVAAGGYESRFNSDGSLIAIPERAISDRERRHLRKLRDDRTNIYDTRTGRRVGVIETELFDYAWSPTTDQIAANVQQSSDLLPVLAVCAPTHEGDTWDIRRFDAYPTSGEPRWSPDGRTIAATTWSHLGANDAETIVWDVVSAAPDARWTKNSTIIRGRTLGWSNDGRTLLLHNGDGIIAWNLDGSFWDVPFPLGEDDKIVLVQPHTGGMDAEDTEGASVVQWSNDDHLLLVYSRDGLGVWSRESGVELARITQPEPLLAASFNSEADRIATLTADGALRVWWTAQGVSSPTTRS
jgi:Mrp family chromosome partitioning ATPase/WD40 repeat protein